MWNFDKHSMTLISESDKLIMINNLTLSCTVQTHKNMQEVSHYII